MKILVAEDNAVAATLMAGILTRHGYTVVPARNSFEALRKLGIALKASAVAHCAIARIAEGYWGARSALKFGLL